MQRKTYTLRDMLTLVRDMIDTILQKKSAKVDFSEVDQDTKDIPETPLEEEADTPVLVPVVPTTDVVRVETVPQVVEPDPVPETGPTILQMPAVQPVYYKRTMQGSKARYTPIDPSSLKNGTQVLIRVPHGKTHRYRAVVYRTDQATMVV